jgi:uncharacterized protein
MASMKDANKGTSQIDAADRDDYVIRTVDDPSQIDPAAWDGLLQRQASPTPFMRHAFLSAMHRSASAVAKTGWQPIFLLMHQANVLVGACALYAKAHSYGEYVFDWSWAQAFERAGRPYYPKLLCAAPFTPVPGTRLLARDDEARDALVMGLQATVKQLGLSSAHVLFPDTADQAAFERQGWMLRRGVQFHWTQPEGAARWKTFDDFTASMQREKRKKIVQERRRVAEQGVTFRVLEGAAITSRDWDFFYRCYAQTYAEHGSPPYIKRPFFDDMAQAMPEAWVLFIATHGGEDIAASLIALDASKRVAYGRYWGAVAHVPLLHFEACYYQPLAWCIQHGVDRFEGGAQGEHKMARGLLPVVTASAHWVADKPFAQAVENFLDREGVGIAAYVSELQERSPMRNAHPTDTVPSPPATASVPSKS